MKKFISKKGMVLAVLSLALIAAIAIGGSLAYFSDSDEVTNTFTMGKVTIDLDEPNWEEDSGLELAPGNVRVKDPTVTATQGQSYMRVRMEIVDGEGNYITDDAQLALILETLYYDTTYDASALTQNLAPDAKYSVAELNALCAQNKIHKEYNKSKFIFAGIETGNKAVRYYNYIANDGIFDADKTPADSAVLFSNVVIPSNWHNEEIFILNGDEYETTENGGIEVTIRGSGYKLRIEAQAIQSAEMASAAEAFAALNAATEVTIDASGI